MQQVCGTDDAAESLRRHRREVTKAETNTRRSKIEKSTKTGTGQMPMQVNHFIVTRESFIGYEDRETETRGIILYSCVLFILDDHTISPHFTSKACPMMLLASV